MENIIHFRSCFICEVNISDTEVELIDSTHSSFFIDKSNDELMAVFKKWFIDVYKACVPQTLTVIQYAILNRNDEPIMIVKSLIYNEKLHKGNILLEKGNN